MCRPTPRMELQGDAQAPRPRKPRVPRLMAGVRVAHAMGRWSCTDATGTVGRAWPSVTWTPLAMRIRSCARMPTQARSYPRPPRVCRALAAGCWRVIEDALCSTAIADGWLGRDPAQVVEMTSGYGSTGGSPRDQVPLGGASAWMWRKVRRALRRYTVVLGGQDVLAQGVQGARSCG